MVPNLPVWNSLGFPTTPPFSEKHLPLPKKKPRSAPSIGFGASNRWRFFFWCGAWDGAVHFLLQQCLKHLGEVVSKKTTLLPIGSMYGIFTYIYHKNQPNVGKYIYTIHGWYGLYVHGYLGMIHIF